MHYIARKNIMKLFLFIYSIYFVLDRKIYCRGRFKIKYDISSHAKRAGFNVNYNPLYTFSIKYANNLIQLHFYPLNSFDVFSNEHNGKVCCSAKWQKSIPLLCCSIVRIIVRNEFKPVTNKCVCCSAHCKKDMRAIEISVNIIS